MMIFSTAFDRILTLRDIPFKVGPNLAEVIAGGVEISVNNVVPGEPIQVYWRVQPGMGIRNTSAKSFSVRILIDDHQVHERKGIPATQAILKGGASIFNSYRNNPIDTITINDPNIARLVYRIGVKTLRVEVRGEDTTGTEFVGSDRFHVEPEPLDESWWEWRVLAFETIGWNTGYTLVGDFVNRSRFASVSLLNAELSEVRNEENPQINPCDYLPVQIQSRNLVVPSAHASFSFSLLHDWHWFKPTVYFVVGPLNKTFSYAVFFHFTDEFGNVYAGQCSARRIRHVGVSKAKRLAAVAAQTAATNAAFWAATFLGWAIAAGWYGVAAAFGHIAEDPPTPDLRFREAVDIAPLPLPCWSADAATASFPATISMLETSAYLAALENARTVSRARLLGACLAGDDLAAEHQRDGYLKIEQLMIETARKIEEILPAVEKEVEDKSCLNPKDVEPMLCRLFREGLLDATSQTMADAGVSHAEINGLSTILRDIDIIELACANGLFLSPFIISLQRFVEEVQGEQEMVLQGETYVHVSGRSKLKFEDAVPEIEAPLRPNAVRCSNPS